MTEWLTIFFLDQYQWFNAQQNIEIRQIQHDETPPRDANTVA
ncbi:MAG: hypothetical protein WCJ06_14135 [Planctomycetota bacterium]